MRYLLACFFVLVAACASAQTQNYLVTWDDPNPVDKGVQGYRVTVDAGTPVNVPYAGATPCTACANTTVVVPVTGTHTIAVSAYNVAGDSLPASLTVGAPTITVPVSPTNLSATPVGPSPSGTIIPPATQILDAANGLWTIEGAGSCPSTVPVAICQSLRLNHVQAALGDRIKIVSAVIYVRGADVPTQHWWRRSGSTWVDTGTTEP